MVEEWVTRWNPATSTVADVDVVVGNSEPTRDVCGSLLKIISKTSRRTESFVGGDMEVPRSQLSRTESLAADQFEAEAFSCSFSL